MPILALDTATLVSSVALATDDRLIAELTLQTRKTHSERLMPHIAELLRMSDLTKDQIKAVAVSIGPGSFTGLRIGLATAKALAYAWNVPLVGVPTLAALAYCCPLPGLVLSPLLDAQKGNMYNALYRWEQGVLKEITPARVIAAEECLAELATRPEPVVLLGEGAQQYRDKAEAIGGSLMIAPPHIIITRAGSVALLAQEMLRQGVRHDVMKLKPYYIRRSEAEELWERRHGVCG